MAQNYYQVLGVSRKATQEDIQAAYSKLAREVYPGVNRGEAEATARMKDINRAYETLRDVEKRRVYNEALNPTPKPSKPPSGAGTQPRTSPGSSGTSVTSGHPFMDAPNTMRNAAQANATGSAGASSSTGSSGNAGPVVEIWLTPREAVEGAEKVIRVNGKPIRLKISIRR